MKPKAKPESKIPTTQKNTNQKRKVPKPDDLAVEGSLLKKNEFTLIIVGALVVTVLVFVFFFRSSDTGGGLPTGNGSGGSAVGMDAQSLEKRIADLEVSLNRVASATPDVDGEMPSPKAIAALDDRVSRLETAVTLKMDALIERMGAMEKRIASLKSKAATVSKRKVAKPAATKTTKTVAVKATSVPVKKKAVQSQKTAQKPAKPKQMFHTVKKGETLWSISQKYKTTVAAIRKLNNLSAQDKIYPGNNILVR